MSPLSSRVGAGLLILLVLAGGLRVANLDARVVGHIEMYVPNLPLPDGISEPPPRPTLARTLTGSLWEVHPPGWYLLMWPWTRVAGVSPEALRLPSAIFGLLSVIVLWAIARRERSAPVAWLAAGLLAINGFHILWSQIARPVTFTVLIGLVTSWLLLRLAGSPSRPLLAGYLALSWLGLLTEYYYWLLFGGQMVWAIIAIRPTDRARPGLLLWQWLMVIAAAPLVTLAIFQSRASYLDADIGAALVRYVSFGFLFDPEQTETPAAGWAVMLATVLGAGLFVWGLVRSSSSPERERLKSPPVWLVLFVTLGATAAAAGAAWAFSRYRPEVATTLRIAAAAPLLSAALGLVVSRLPGLLAMSRPLPLSVVLAIVPPGAAALLSLALPFLDAKYFLLFSPFLLIVVAEGVMSLRRHVPGAMRHVAMAVLGVLILAVHGHAFAFNAGKDASPIDHRALAREMAAELRASDVILTFRHYALTPIYYHLRDHAGQFVGQDHAAALAHRGARRVWLISLRDSAVPDPPDIRAALQGCSLVRTVVARRIRAELYEACPVHSARAETNN